MTVRLWRPGDVAARPAVGAIRDACRDHDGSDPLDEAADLTLRRLARGESRPGTRLWLAPEKGFAFVHEGQLELAVAPAARRRGLAGALAEACRDSADPAHVDRAWSHSDHPGARALARQHGFTAARSLWVMRRPAEGHGGAALPALGPPPGVQLRGFRDEDSAALLAVNAAAFARHPEQGALDEAGLRERMAEPWWDPTGLILAVAEADGDLLGFHWTKHATPGTGEVYVVAIAPRAQGRGLGRVLTLAGLHHLAAAGVTETALHVESDNDAALAVYSGLGFTHLPADTHVLYRRAAAR